MLKDPYLKAVYQDTVERNAEQKEFLQAVREVFESLEPYVVRHPEFQEAGIMERLVGFFLMGTALYLLSILPESRRLPALAALLACALAAWML